MATSARAFRIGLYEEHLEEASFLYDQRQVLLSSPELAWTAMAAFEQRFEAHLDALIVGGDLALAVCRARAQQGDAGELFAAVCVGCRQGLAPVLSEILVALDYADPTRPRALGDALKHELPASWHQHLLAAVSRGSEQLTQLLADVIGYRRLAGTSLVARLGHASPAVQKTIIQAIGRTRENGATEDVRWFYETADASTQSAALRTGLRLHDPQALRRLLELVPTDRRLLVDLALAGDRSAVAAVLPFAQGATPDTQAVTALGLLGDLSTVTALLRLLSIEAAAGAAAEALHVITGAPLFEEAFVPEPVSPEELFDKELTAYHERGELPHRGNGEPFGQHVERLSLDPEVWGRWLRDNAGHFNAELRYRYGRPYSPEVLLACLSANTFPKAYRQLIADELLVRYGIDVALEVDMTVARQRSVIGEAARTIGRDAAAFAPGRWYTAGRE